MLLFHLTVSLLIRKLGFPKLIPDYLCYAAFDSNSNLIHQTNPLLIFLVPTPREFLIHVWCNSLQNKSESAAADSAGPNPRNKIFIQRDWDEFTELVAPGESIKLDRPPQHIKYAFLSIYIFFSPTKVTIGIGLALGIWFHLIAPRSVRSRWRQN